MSEHNPPRREPPSDPESFGTPVQNPEGPSGSEGRGRTEVVEVRVGLATCGVASGARAIKQAMEEELHDLGAQVYLKTVGCAGLCHHEPLMEVVTRDGKTLYYGGMSAAVARRVIREHVRSRSLFRRVETALRSVINPLFDDRAWEPTTSYFVDKTKGGPARYLARQKRIVMENCGEINPLEIVEYAERGGYEALRHVLGTMTPEEVIEQVRASGLRGRGGAGFNTADKWQLTRRQSDKKKYIVCNADEGDPGAFMDRLVLESDPHRVLEGIAVAAYAVGADEAYVYVRAEYPLAVEHLKVAIAQATEHGYLGERIFDSDFSLEIHAIEGAGAFVCGEETALIASLEGKRGMPRFRPPYPSQCGLWGKPTCVNNVETFACVPWILRNGPDSFAALGTARSKGTKVFALAGKVKRGGLIEVPMGITIGEIVEEIGGGVWDGRTFKAVQVGGPSGGCLPASLADTPIDFEALTEVGAMMGSGGLVVLDNTDCMVDIARFFLQFTQEQSCGKCTFCRVGTKRMLEILERLCAGLGRKGDLAELEHLAGMVGKGSLCGLGKTAPNPVLTTLRYFRDEYEAHLEGRCPAGSCKELITYLINDDCIGCTRCAQHCPVEAIAFNPYQKHEIDTDKCIRCGTCQLVCPSDAVKIE